MWPGQGSHRRCEGLHRQELRSQRQKFLENLVLTRHGDGGIQFRNMFAGASQVQREPRQGSAASPVGEKDPPSHETRFDHGVVNASPSEPCKTSTLVYYLVMGSPCRSQRGCASTGDAPVPSSQQRVRIAVALFKQLKYADRGVISINSAPPLPFEVVP